MRHATPQTIAGQAALLAQIRALGGLSEKKPGVFYRKSRAFLHFHEEGDRLFADVRLAGSDFTRLPASTAAERCALVAAIAEAIRS